MPQTERKISRQLGIRLNDGRPTYAPGDIIVGQVFRKDHIIASKAILKLSLHARSKSRLVVRHASATRVYRGRFDLVNEPNQTQTLFQGPLHIPTGGDEQAWPFAITLPTRLDPTAITSDVSQAESYLPLAAAEVAQCALPPSFFTQDYGFGEGMEAFVEYFLRAELKTGKHGSKGIEEAILPLSMITLNLEPPDIETAMEQSQHAQVVSSNIFTNGRPIDLDARPLGSESAPPTLAFSIHVQTPSSLQLDQSDSIPFLVQAVMDRDKATKILQDTTPEICVTDISVTIVASTEIRCRGKRDTRHQKTETKIDLLAQKAYRTLGETIYIPWADKPGPSSDDVLRPASHQAEHAALQSLDIGKNIGLRLKDEDVHESFQTYNIQHKHRLEWELVLHIGGQDRKLTGTQPIRIMAPNRIDAPVPYTQHDPEQNSSRRQSQAVAGLPPDYSETGRNSSVSETSPRRGSRWSVSQGLAPLWQGF